MDSSLKPGECDDNRAPEPRSSPCETPSKEEQQAEQREFACPFVKRHPSCPPKSQACTHGFKDIHRLKEHLRRVHKSPPSCCRCHADFKSQGKVDAHLRKVPVCDITTGTPKVQLGTITDEQMEALKRRLPAELSQVQRWEMIYKILFPTESNIPYPYTTDLESHLRTNLPPTIYALLDDNSTPGTRALLDAGATAKSLAEFRAELRADLKPIIEKAVRSVLRDYKGPQTTLRNDGSSTDVPDNPFPSQTVAMEDLAQCQGSDQPAVAFRTNPVPTHNGHADFVAGSPEQPTQSSEISSATMEPSSLPPESPASFTDFLNYSVYQDPEIGSSSEPTNLGPDDWVRLLAASQSDWQAAGSQVQEDAQAGQSDQAPALPTATAVVGSKRLASASPTRRERGEKRIPRTVPQFQGSFHD